MKIVNAVDKSQINLVHALIEKKFGQLYADIWKVGVNMSLRISDLLALKYSDLDLSSRSVRLIDQKTRKKNMVRLNQAVIDIVSRRRLENPDHIWLFQVQCNRAKDKPIHRNSVGRVFKEAGDMLGFTISTHSMRKSRGMALYNDGVPVEKIAMVLNHSNTTHTLCYLGITQEQVLQTYDDYLL